MLYSSSQRVSPNSFCLVLLTSNFQLTNQIASKWFFYSVAFFLTFYDSLIIDGEPFSPWLRYEWDKLVIVIST